MVMKLWWREGWGSALIEAQAAEYGLALDLIALDHPATGEQAQADSAELNALGQVPTMQLSDGSVMTESAAITLFLAARQDSDLLVPRPQAPEYAAFLRWLIWLVANVYPCVSYYAHPERLVADPVEARGLQARLLERMEAQWRQVDAEAGTPWFLGERFSALDIYLAVMLHWGPGLAWAAEHVPRLYNIGAAAARRPAIAPVMARNFPDGLGAGLAAPA